MTKKKKIIFLVGMVALIVITAFCNVLISNKIKDDDSDNTEPTMSTQDFFAYYRTRRTESRDQSASYLRAVINDETADSTAIQQATTALKNLNNCMELELALESYIMASIGVSDVCVNASDTTKYINVIVSEEVTAEQRKAIQVEVSRQMSSTTDYINIIIIN